jgi:hypothetical protein
MKSVGEAVVCCGVFARTREMSGSACHAVLSMNGVRRSKSFGSKWQLDSGPAGPHCAPNRQIESDGPAQFVATLPSCARTVMKFAPSGQMSSTAVSFEFAGSRRAVPVQGAP